MIAPAGPVAETVAGTTEGAPPGGRRRDGRGQRRRALLGAAGAAGGGLGGLLLTACAGPAAGTSGASGPSGGEAGGPPLNLKVWGPPPATEPGATMARQLVELGQARPRLKVELEPVQTAGTDVTKAVALLAAGTGPDVFYLGRWLTAQFAAYRTIAAVDQHVTRAAKTLPLGDYYPRFVAESRWRGALYGIPYVTTTRGLFYNQGHFQEAGLPADRPPATWEQLDQASARLLGRGPDGQLTRVGYVAGAGNPGTYLGWMVYLWQLGGDVLAADNKRVSPDLVRLGGQALETMAAQIQRNGGWAAIEALTTGAPLPQGADLFSSGRCSMLFHQQQQVLAYDRVSGLKYGVAPFPLPPGGKRVNFAAGPNLALFGGTKQPDAAWEIVEYLSEVGRLTAFNVAGGSMPPRRSAAQSKDYLALHPTMRFFADEQEVGRWVPIVPGIQDIFFALDETVTPAIKGQLAPRDAVEQASARLTAILKQNEAYL